MNRLPQSKTIKFSALILGLGLLLLSPIARAGIIHRYAWDGDTKGILMFLDRTDINTKDEKGYTALMVATARDNIDMVKLLLDKKANVNIKADDGTTALSLANEKGHTEIVELLKKAGAK